MVTRLERFDEVLAEINNLPSPYLLRQEELVHLQVRQMQDDISSNLRDALKPLLNVGIISRWRGPRV